MHSIQGSRLWTGKPVPHASCYSFPRTTFVVPIAQAGPRKAQAFVLLAISGDPDMRARNSGGDPDSGLRHIERDTRSQLKPFLKPQSLQGIPPPIRWRPLL